MEQRVINSVDGEPELSVIIPAHNAAATIVNALASVARQDGLRPEIIVADDASRDDTAKVVADWARAHPHIPLSLIRMKTRVYALRARLAALGQARAPDVMYLDADDSWEGIHRVPQALAQKRRMECEVLHFRSTGFLDGKSIGELLWTAPPLDTCLSGKEIFAAYARMEYIPLQLWNKIYSRILLQRAAQFVGNSEIFYFDDKFFVSLVLMCASSWAHSEEYIYRYILSPAWPLEKSCKCAHDLLEIRKKAEVVFPILGIDAQSRQDYLYFINRRLVYHFGRLSINVEKQLTEDSTPHDILAQITEWLPMGEVLPALVAGAQKNVQRIIKISRRIHEKF